MKIVRTLWVFDFETIFRRIDGSSVCWDFCV